MENLENLTDDKDMIEIINAIDNHRAARVYRLRPNQFEVWDDNQFVKRFWLSKHAVNSLIDNVADQIRSPTERNHAVSATEMVLVTLHFYATGSFLQVVGDFIGIDKSTASRIVYKVSRAIANLNRLFVTMPATEAQNFIEGIL